jgi:hypothetical protein
MRRRGEVDYRRGWNAFLPPAYRQDVLERILACRAAGGRPLRAPNLETARDLNADGRPDYLVDLSALRCQRRQGLAASEDCGAAGCALHLYLSTPGGGHGPAMALVAQRWTLREEGPPRLLIQARGCAEEACAQRYGWNGAAFAPLAP